MEAATGLTSSEYMLTGPRSLRTRTRVLDEVEPGWVRVRFLYCGICGSDISHFEGRPDVSYPITVGHEFVAEVVGLGDGVRDLTVGDIVTSDLNFRCGKCDHCLAGRSHLCRTGQRGEFTNRGFADFGDMRRSYLLRIDGPPTRQMTLTEPLSCVLHAKQWASLGADDRVLVIGAGSIGLCMSLALSQQPPYPTFHVTDEIPSRLRLVDEALGSRGYAQADPEGEYDVVFDVSGTEEGLRRACDHVRAGGRLCSMSHPNVDPISPFLVGEILRRDVTFTVSYLNGEWENMRTAAELLEQHWTPEWDQAIEVVPIDCLQEAHENRHVSPWCKTVIDVAGNEP